MKQYGIRVNLDTNDVKLAEELLSNSGYILCSDGIRLQAYTRKIGFQDPSDLLANAKAEVAALGLSNNEAIADEI